MKRCHGCHQYRTSDAKCAFDSAVIHVYRVRIAIDSVGDQIHDHNWLYGVQ